MNRISRIPHRGNAAVLLHLAVAHILNPHKYS